MALGSISFPDGCHDCVIVICVVVVASDVDVLRIQIVIVVVVIVVPIVVVAVRNWKKITVKHDLLKKISEFFE